MLKIGQIIPKITRCSTASVTQAPQAPISQLSEAVSQAMAQEARADLIVYKSADFVKKYMVKANGEFREAVVKNTYKNGYKSDFKEGFVAFLDDEKIADMITKKLLKGGKFAELYVPNPEKHEKSFSDYILSKEESTGFIYIHTLYSEKKAKGAGSSLVKYAVEKSLKEGYDGRIVLKAINTDNVLDSPVKFYKKLGFEFIDSEQNKLYEKWEKTGGEMPFEILSGYMYLPKKNIAKAFGYKPN